MNEQNKVAYSPKAREDIKEISFYIASTLGAPAAAIRIVGQIQKQIFNLSTLPERFPVIDREPWKTMHIRRVPVGHFLICYTIQEQAETVVIIRILYGGRDVMRILSENQE